jgi:hypothetical protein
MDVSQYLSSPEHEARRKKNIVNTMYSNLSWHNINICLYNLLQQMLASVQ